MNQTLQRASLLYQHSRYQEAEQELRRALAEQPQNPQAHALLGLCLVKQERLDEGQTEVEQAIVLAPDWPHAHYCRSIVLDHRDRHEAAEASAREALRLDAADPDYYARLGATLYHQRRWQDALDAADQGLQYDAEHADCGNLRTMALTKLGRKQEAIRTVDQALARDPDDAFAHSNKGWALLHQGQPKPALEHFREALRLDPTFEYAKQGMVEALKARYFIYRWMLAYFLWMARLGDGARWGVIVGGWFMFRFLRTAARENPALAPWLAPLILLYIVFVLLTWFAVPLFNLLLRLNRFGRHALSRDQRTASNWFALCLLAFVGCVAAAFLVDNAGPAAGAITAAGVALPLVTAYQVSRGWPRTALLLFAGVMTLIGAVHIAGATLNRAWGDPAFFAFLIAFFFTPWIANALAGVTVSR